MNYRHFFVDELLLFKCIVIIKALLFEGGPLRKGFIYAKKIKKVLAY